MISNLFILSHFGMKIYFPHFKIPFIDRNSNYVDFTETFEALAMAIMSTLSAKEKG